MEINCARNAHHQHARQEAHYVAHDVLEYFGMFGERQAAKHLTTYMTAIYLNECNVITDEIRKAIDSISISRGHSDAPKSCHDYVKELQHELNQLTERLTCHASKYLLKMPLHPDLEATFLDHRQTSNSATSVAFLHFAEPLFSTMIEKINQQTDCATGKDSIIKDQRSLINVSAAIVWANFEIKKKLLYHIFS